MLLQGVEGVYLIMQLDELKKKLNSVDPVIQIEKVEPAPINGSWDILKGFFSFKILVPEILELSLKLAIIFPGDPSTILKLKSVKDATRIKKYFLIYLDGKELSDEDLICLVLKQKEVLIRDKIMGDVLCEFTCYKRASDHSSHNYVITRDDT